MADPEGLDWRYSPSEELDLDVVARLKHFPREPEMYVYALRSAAALGLRAWLRLYHRYEVSGLEHLPKEGSFVLVANHASHLDALCLLSALPLKKLHRAFPAAAKDYFFSNLQGLGFSVILLNAIPFERSARAGQSLALCRQLLANPGNILILFPEGTRTQNGAMGPFKPGIGSLVAGTGVPVVPCFLHGAFAAFPKGASFPSPRKVRLVVGQPMTFAEVLDSREGVHRVAQELFDAVARLGAEMTP
jgi:1-acyl-sn-glycerol-3-phosphate acyltransferase